jgi:hypothetical protein
MKDYNKAFIYKISNGKLHYYGSSAVTYEHRKQGHMAKSNLTNSKIIINSGLPWTMEIVEYFPCSCVEELQDREAWYITNNECVNEKLPGAYRRAGGKIAYHKAYLKRYRQDNKAAIKATKKRYRQDNKAAIKASNNQYYQDNKAAIKARNKRYEEGNAEAIKARKKRRYQEDVCKQVLHDMINRIESEFTRQTNEGPPTRVQPYQARPKGE